MKDVLSGPFSGLAGPSPIGDSDSKQTCLAACTMHVPV